LKVERSPEPKENHPLVSQPFAPSTPTYSFFRTCCRIAATVFFDLKVYGVEHVPNTGGVLLLSNHLSFLDPACIGVQLRRPASYLAKSELFDVPVFGRVIPRLNAVPVRQGAGDIGAVRETIKRLKEGRVLTVFPEGARSLDGELQPLQGGFTLIVRKAGVPIVPVGIDGSYEAWARGTALPSCARVRVKFGPPLHVQELKPAEIITAVESALRGLIADLRAMRKVEEELDLPRM
jgi:1-acyl-sn-glycerol-3-phosphate acyltransferase